MQPTPASSPGRPSRHPAGGLADATWRGHAPPEDAPEGPGRGALLVLRPAGRRLGALPRSQRLLPQHATRPVPHPRAAGDLGPRARLRQGRPAGRRRPGARGGRRRLAAHGRAGEPQVSRPGVRRGGRRQLRHAGAVRLHHPQQPAGIRRRHPGPAAQLPSPAQAAGAHPDQHAQPDLDAPAADRRAAGPVHPRHPAQFRHRAGCGQPAGPERLRGREADATDDPAQEGPFGRPAGQPACVADARGPSPLPDRVPGGPARRPRRRAFGVGGGALLQRGGQHRRVRPARAPHGHPYRGDRRRRRLSGRHRRSGQARAEPGRGGAAACPISPTVASCTPCAPGSRPRAATS